MHRLLHQVSDKDRELIGGKAFALARMLKSGLNVPPALCIGADTYSRHISSSGLRDRIHMELHRKNFGQMRWEEIWDVSLRIRNIFLKTPMPAELHRELAALIESTFGFRPVVVRSSAPGEDSLKTSFAGLHESYVNVKGVDQILKHICLVWASLWSDRALLYRQELSLDIEKSSMAVIVQELIPGERSGVVFGRSPVDDSQAVVEAVHGLNQGLVDGTVEPDRWILERETGKVISHSPATREKGMILSPEGVRLGPLSPEKSTEPPLNAKDITEIHSLVQRAEELFASPQDVEWTFKGNGLFALQSRPITAATGETSDKERSWYLSLKRSYENLRTLKEKIEGELIPAMIDEAERLAGKDLAALSDAELSIEIGRRSRIHKEWEETYIREFIPFAHGARLFGQVYNDVIRPADPYEFTNLLGGTQMASIRRNRMLAEMADMIRSDPLLAERLQKNTSPGPADHPFNKMLDSFMKTFGDFSFAGTQSSRDREGTIKLLLQMASREPTQQIFKPADIRKLTGTFLSRFEGEQRKVAEDLLDLARASYQLRDDDNIYIGKIEGQYLAALEEGRRRVGGKIENETAHVGMNEIVKALNDPDYRPAVKKPASKALNDPSLKVRQIVGQPAGPGIGTGKARVIEQASDLFDFKAGEILVCDAIDPNMTFVVPMSAGIVERRGGMLIHGAIIAREYGLPCVTGVPDATSLIHTGQQVTVDGHLGIVIVGLPTLGKAS